MARVVSTVLNDLGEVTGVTVMKGNRRDVLKRHSSCVIPYLQMKEVPYNSNPSAFSADEEQVACSSTDAAVTPQRPRRKAKLQAADRIRSLYRDC